MADGKCSFKGYPAIVGGRYGLGSKEFTPGMAKGVFDNLKRDRPKNHFVVGINEDVTNTRSTTTRLRQRSAGTYSAMFYGLGSDGTVGANKNSIKIIGETTDNNVQAYFVYDSKKAGSVTTSHLRFGKGVIRSPYLIDQADFIACHNFSFLEKYDMLAGQRGRHLPALLPVRQGPGLGQHADRGAAADHRQEAQVLRDQRHRAGRGAGLGARINVIMQTAFFKISNIMPLETALDAIKDAIKKSYGKSGEKVVEMNNKAVDAALENIFEVQVPAAATSNLRKPPVVGAHAPQFVQEVTATIIAGYGDDVPVSMMPADGTFPTATSQYEKRNIAVDIPVWDEALCIQCGICSFVCPHATIRMKAYDADKLAGAPATFKSVDAKGNEFKGMKFTVQVAPEDCTGCGACVAQLPGQDQGGPEPQGDQHEVPAAAARQRGRQLRLLPGASRTPTRRSSSCDTLKGSQLVTPLFEYSGACAGCGETPYLKLLSQLFGDRALIANATGCTSIYGGNLPTTPWAQAQGRPRSGLVQLALRGQRRVRFRHEARGRQVHRGGPGAADRADRLRLHVLRRRSRGSWRRSRMPTSRPRPASKLQRGRVAKLKEALAGCDEPAAKKLLSLADYLVKKSVWCVGGDGWAYDIGYGGLDHVIASGKNVNLLVLDTEVYSNTGGQASKSTPMGAVAQFAAGGKPQAKKDLAMIAMAYGNVYVAKVALSNPAQVVKAFMEAEAYDGPSLIIAYSPLHRPRHRHDHRRRRAEEGGRLRPLAAGPLQPGAGRAGEEPAAAGQQGADHLASRSTPTARTATAC